MTDIFTSDEFDSCEFKDLDLTEARLEDKDIALSVFEHCNFAQTHLEGCRIEKTRFVDCNVGNVFNERARLIDVEFIRCKIIGLSLFKCDQTVFDIAFRECKLVLCNFSDVSMKGASFVDCEIEESYFQNAFLRDATFRGTRFTDTVFSKCDLRKATFADASGYSIDPRDNHIEKCSFSVPAVFGLLDGFDIKIL
ncbi:MAG TPA: pentapeptide repeat-containing protein [Treponemataceae bacterium]|nr:pentapeptide repeat-containing protein [Treponemataceae bacterium]